MTTLKSYLRSILLPVLLAVLLVNAGFDAATQWTKHRAERNLQAIMSEAAQIFPGVGVTISFSTDGCVILK